MTLFAEPKLAWTSSAEGSAILLVNIAIALRAWVIFGRMLASSETIANHDQNEFYPR
jgi:hypothetical protein